jgi:hypothetical protein
MRIAATTASRPPGPGGPAGQRGPQPPQPPEPPQPPSPPLATRRTASRPPRAAIRQNARIIAPPRRIPADAITRYLPRRHPTASAVKCAAVPINRSGGRPLARNCRAAGDGQLAAGRRGGPRRSTKRSVRCRDRRKGRGRSPLCRAAARRAQPRDLPGQAPGRPAP